MPLPDFEDALKDRDEIDLTTTGRTSGRESTRPVWFVRQVEVRLLAELAQQPEAERLVVAGSAASPTELQPGRDELTRSFVVEWLELREALEV